MSVGRFLIQAAAGSGDISYWVARIDAGVSANYHGRATVNETNKKIIVRGAWSTGQVYMDLDYDGNLNSVKTTPITYYSGEWAKGCLASLNSGVFIHQSHDTYNDKITEIESSTDTSYDGRRFFDSQYIGVRGYHAHSHSMVVDQQGADDRLIFTANGYNTTYYPPYFQPGLGVFIYEPSEATAYSIIDGRYVLGSGNESGYDYRYSMVAAGQNQKFAVAALNAETTKTLFGTYSTGSSKSFTYSDNYSSSANHILIGLGVDSNDKVSAISAVSNQCFIFKGSVAGTYVPSTRYSHSISSPVGQYISADFDSDGNAYVLCKNLHLTKFNTSGAVEWCLKLYNSVTGTSYINDTNHLEVKVESINDTEFLMLCLKYPVESSTYPFYVIKAPLDLNNYTGTYGNIQISTASYSPTITTNSESQSSTTASVIGASINTVTEAVTTSSGSITTSDI